MAGWTRATALMVGTACFIASGAVLVAWKTGHLRHARTNPADTASDLPPAAKHQAPRRNDYPEFSPWLAALRAYSEETVDRLGDRFSLQAKALRSATFADVLSAEINSDGDPQQKLLLGEVLAEQREILASLIDPQSTLREAWAQFGLGRTRKAIQLLELLVVNPNYRCRDLEIVLSYWEVLESDWDRAIARLQKVAADSDYRNRDLAAYLVVWSHLQQGDLQAARAEVDAFLASHPTSRFGRSAGHLLDRLRNVTEPRAGPSDEGNP